MIKRTIEISGEQTYLSVHNGQLVIKREGLEVGRVPCEDIGLLILDSKATSYTHTALVEPLRHDAVIVLCGDNHHPAAFVLPVAANSLQTERLRRQAEAKKPLAKKLWKHIVQAKIANQAAVLEDAEPAARMRALIASVRSGDPANVEARAARIYWPALFGDAGFRRDPEGGPPNNLLNYGYMVLRASMARAICGSGLHPSLGLQHHNRYNPFCLADDLLEPYRPWVDGRVRELHVAGIRAIDRNVKHRLLEVLTDSVRVSGEAGPIMVAMQKTAASLGQCYAGEGEELALPES